MNNTKRNEKINELESIETVLGITKADYAAEKLLEQYEKTGLQTEALFDRLSSMSDEEIIEMYLDFWSITTSKRKVSIKLIKENLDYARYSTTSENNSYT